MLLFRGGAELVNLIAPGLQNYLDRPESTKTKSVLFQFTSHCEVVYNTPAKAFTRVPRRKWTQLDSQKRKAEKVI